MEPDAESGKERLKSMVLEFLAYQFGVRALIGGLIIAVTCSGLGVFLVLRRLSLVADGLSHVAFGGIAFGLYSGIYPLYTAVVGVILGALGIHALGKLRVASDAAIAILFAAGLAIGIMLISVTQNVAVDVLSFLFGTILGINQTDLYLAAALGIIVVGILLVFWKEWVSITVDAEFARVSGLPVPALELVFTILTGLTVVVAMRLVGVLLVSSLIVIPASAMIQLKMPFRRTVLSACAVAVVSVVAGLQLSFMYNLAPGGSIVFVTILFFILAAVGVRLFPKIPEKTADGGSWDHRCDR
ncbi:MAG TPA: metal ABC transporter permease [Methanoregula sp.]|nr:metal ABC transporter permease [Methanoregula sp.]